MVLLFFPATRSCTIAATSATPILHWIPPPQFSSSRPKRSEAEDPRISFLLVSEPHSIPAQTPPPHSPESPHSRSPPAHASPPTPHPPHSHSPRTSDSPSCRTHRC